MQRKIHTDLLGPELINANQQKQENIKNTSTKGMSLSKMMMYLNTVKAVPTGHYERTNNMTSNWEPEIFSGKGSVNFETTHCLKFDNLCLKQQCLRSENSLRQHKVWSLTNWINSSRYTWSLTNNSVSLTSSRSLWNIWSVVSCIHTYWWFQQECVCHGPRPPRWSHGPQHRGWRKGFLLSWHGGPSGRHHKLHKFVNAVWDEAS